MNDTMTGFAARPSGIEDIYEIRAERFGGAEDLQHIITQAQAIVDAAISPAPSSANAAPLPGASDVPSGR